MAAVLIGFEVYIAFLLAISVVNMTPKGKCLIRVKLKHINIVVFNITYFDLLGV